MDEFSRELVLLINQYGPGRMTLEETKRLCSRLRKVIAKPSLFEFIDKHPQVPEVQDE